MVEVYHLFRYARLEIVYLAFKLRGKNKTKNFMQCLINKYKYLINGALLDEKFREIKMIGC